MIKDNILGLICDCAKAADWSVRLVRDTEKSKNSPLPTLLRHKVDNTNTPFLLLQKELCKLIIYSDHDDILWVCSYPEMDDVFSIYQMGEEWFISHSAFNCVLVMQMLEQRFQEVKALNQAGKVIPPSPQLMFL